MSSPQHDRRLSRALNHKPSLVAWAALLSRRQRSASASHTPTDVRQVLAIKNHGLKSQRA